MDQLKLMKNHSFCLNFGLPMMQSIVLMKNLMLMKIFMKKFMPLMDGFTDYYGEPYAIRQFVDFKAGESIN